MSQPSLPPCDVVIAPNRAVYINGTLVTNLTDFDFNYGQNQPIPEITLTFTPTSMVFGDVPNDTIDALAFERMPDDGTVNISRAIARAQARAMGLDPNAHVKPAPAPTAAPVPARTTVTKKIATYAEPTKDEVYPEDDDECGSTDTKGGSPCKRPYGHTGIHRTYA